jgi:hypothetical protein
VEDADLTIMIDRCDLEDVMIETRVKSGWAGKSKMVGNPQVLAQLGSTIVKFDERFEVLPKRRM